MKETTNLRQMYCPRCGKPLTAQIIEGQTESDGYTFITSHLDFYLHVKLFCNDCKEQFDVREDSHQTFHCSNTRELVEAHLNDLLHRAYTETKKGRGYFETY